MSGDRIPLFILMIWALGASQPLAAQTQYNSTDHLPHWIHSILFHDTGRAAIPPVECRVHTNAFIGTWEVNTSTGRRYAYWGDTTRFILRVFDRDRIPLYSILADLAADVSVALSHDPKGEDDVTTIFDLKGRRSTSSYTPVDSMPATGRTSSILGRAVVERQGSRFKSTSDPITCWTTSQEPKLFHDLLSWVHWLPTVAHHTELQTLVEVRSGLALDHRYIYDRGDTLRITFTSIEQGPAPMPRFNVVPVALEDRRPWVKRNSRIGPLPQWMRVQVSDLPPDPSTTERMPHIGKPRIPDNRFIGHFTATLGRIGFNVDIEVDPELPFDTRTPEVRFSYWSDARRASLSAIGGYGDTIYYLVDLDADVRLFARKGPGVLRERVHISTTGDGGISSDAEDRWPLKELKPTGRMKELLGVQCTEYIPTDTQPEFLDVPNTSFWFSDLQVHPFDDMVNWGPGQIPGPFSILSMLSVPGMPLAFEAIALRIDSIELGVTPPPRHDLRGLEPEDTRLR